MSGKSWQSYFSNKDLREISQAEQEQDPKILVAIGDLFALGVLLIQSDIKRKAGYKSCITAMRALKLSAKLQNKVNKLLDKKQGNIHEMFKPHIEIRSLFNE